MAILFWGRKGHAESLDALRFLKAHGYAADEVRDLAASPPRGAELHAIAKGLGGELWAAVDPRHPECATRLPAGPATGPDELATVLEGHPALLKSPILLTPKGALAGFRERRWRDFLDIGKGRS